MKPIEFPAAATPEQVAAAQVIIENSQPDGFSCDVIYDDEASELVIVFENETPAEAMSVVRDRSGRGRYRSMKIIDALAIITNRLAAGAVDTDTATEQVRVLCDQYGRDPHDLIIEVARDLARTKSALAAKNLKVQ